PRGQLCTAGNDGVVRLWDSYTGVLLAELSGHEGAVSTVEWSESGALLVSASNDGTARVWSADDRAPVLTLTPHGGQPVFWAAFGRGDTVIATTGGDNRAAI